MSRTRIVKQSEDTGAPPTTGPQPGDFVRGVFSRSIYLVTRGGLAQVTSVTGREGSTFNISAGDPYLYEPVDVTLAIGDTAAAGQEARVQVLARTQYDTCGLAPAGPKPGTFVQGMATGVLYLVTATFGMVDVVTGRVSPACDPRDFRALFRPVNVTIIIEGE